MRYTILKVQAKKKQTKKETFLKLELMAFQRGFSPEKKNYNTNEHKNTRAFFVLFSSCSVMRPLVGQPTSNDSFKRLKKNKK